MVAQPDVAAVARLLADETRASMLATLGDGSARPASELAALAAVSKSTASAHLAKLVDQGLVAVEQQGRHRYFRLAGPHVAEAIEALAVIAPKRPIRSLRESRASEALRQARTCYDHLAGGLGVALAEVLVARGVLRPAGNEYVLGPRGEESLARLGLDLDKLIDGRRTFARRCLDWSERRHHVAGALGGALAEQLFRLGWLERTGPGRVVRVTPSGRAGFQREFGLEL